MKVERFNGVLRVWLSEVSGGQGIEKGLLGVEKVEACAHGIAVSHSSRQAVDRPTTELFSARSFDVVSCVPQ